jgi:hypothetical protein
MLPIGRLPTRRVKTMEIGCVMRPFVSNTMLPTRRTATLELVSLWKKMNSVYTLLAKKEKETSIFKMWQTYFEACFKSTFSSRVLEVNQRRSHFSCDNHGRSLAYYLCSTLPKLTACPSSAEGHRFFNYVQLTIPTLTKRQSFVRSSRTVGCAVGYVTSAAERNNDWFWKICDFDTVGIVPSSHKLEK